MIYCIITLVYSQMEDQLMALGERWAHVCRWTEDRWIRLQEILAKWQLLLEEEFKFCNWLEKKEILLEEMKVDSGSDSRIILEQVKQLQVSIPSSMI